MNIVVLMAWFWSKNIITTACAFSDGSVPLQLTSESECKHHYACECRFQLKALARMLRGAVGGQGGEEMNDASLLYEC